MDHPARSVIILISLANSRCQTNTSFNMTFKLRGIVAARTCYLDGLKLINRIKVIIPITKIYYNDLIQDH